MIYAIHFMKNQIEMRKTKFDIHFNYTQLILEEMICCTEQMEPLFTVSVKLMHFRPQVYLQSHW